MIADTEEVEFFKKAEAPIHENEKVRELKPIKRYKNKQLTWNI